MKIYTSNFAAVKKLNGNTLVSIARKSPFWFKGFEMKELAPEASWMHDAEPIYTPKFEAVLSRLDFISVWEKLKSFEAENIILLCYEKQGDFCHRHLVAKWFRENGVEAVEYAGAEKADRQVKVIKNKEFSELVKSPHFRGWTNASLF